MGCKVVVIEFNFGYFFDGVKYVEVVVCKMVMFLFFDLMEWDIMELDV